MSDAPDSDVVLTTDDPLPSDPTAVNPRSSQCCPEGYLFEPGSLGHYIETVERFSFLLEQNLDATIAVAERIDAVVGLLERRARDQEEEIAVVQCFQNVSWVGGSRSFELTHGKAIRTASALVQLEFPVVVDGPVEFELVNKPGSFLVMKQIRCGSHGLAQGDLLRHCGLALQRGQLLTVVCGKPDFSVDTPNFSVDARTVPHA